MAFWLAKARPNGTPVYPVSHRGVIKDPAAHALDLADHVVIMGYRNIVTGPTGIISLVRPTVTQAATSRARVFVGIKMADIGPKSETFHGLTEPAMMNALAEVDRAFRPHRGYAGLAFFMYHAFSNMPAQSPLSPARAAGQ